jgi:thiol-disulfide isomerase/thioredoxin
VYSGPVLPEDTELRPVLFDDHGHRFNLTSDHSQSSRLKGTTAQLAHFRLDPALLPPSKIAHLGLEEVTPEGHLKGAEKAFLKAKSAGLAVLPPPRKGQVYEFALTADSGQIIASGQLRGHVVLIDCWATWCGPCMAKMPKLKELLARYAKDGLTVLGINWDANAQVMRKACNERGLNWPQVFVPDDEATRELWSAAGNIRSLPHILVIDREGRLQQVRVAPDQVEQAVTRLVAKPGPQPKFHSKEAPCP